MVSLHLELRAAETYQLLWSRTLSGPVSDVFVLQRQLSSAAIAALRHRHLVSAVPPTKGAAHGIRITSNVEAYAGVYAQGRTFESRHDVPGNLQRAVTLFERALARDSNFAQAHAALGRVSLRLYHQHQGTEWIDRARVEMLEALRLDPDSPTTRYSLAALYAETGQTGVAREELQRVIAQDPENDDAHRLLGRLEADAGDLDAALPHLETARRLHTRVMGKPPGTRSRVFLRRPVSGGRRRLSAVDGAPARFCLGLLQTLGTAYHAAGDRLRALENYRKAIAIAPSAKSYSNMGTLL